MGLDMYLKGSRFYLSSKREKDAIGVEIEGQDVRLGYWRKHPNLHGFIVENFADGKDECQEIDLDAERLRLLIQAIKADDLPKTNGFFFGESQGADDQDSIKQLEGALAWLAVDEGKDVWKSVSYRASW